MVGKPCSASLVAMWEPYLSYGLALALKIALQSAFLCLWRFWARGKVWITKSMKKDMECIANMLIEPEFSPIWSQYIGLLIPCEATHQILSDASYAGIGGFQIPWQVMQTDCLALGFNMNIIDRFAGEPLDAGSKGLHINPLEFIACIVNLWLLI
jgi:hypothetical protein